MMDRATYYITNYDWLMTPKERLALRQLTLQEKVNHAASPAMKKLLVDRWGSDDQEILAIVEMGWERFLQMVYDRIVGDHPNELGKCPKCQKLTATLQAKQCFACGHDWHDNEINIHPEAQTRRKP